MDMVENGTIIDPMKGSEDAVQYHASRMSSNCHVVGNNMINTSTGMTALGNSMVESSACSSGPTVEAFCPPIWEQPFNGRSLGHSDMYVHNYASISTSLGPVRAGVGWTPNTTLREGLFLPNFPGMLPYGLPHFPVDSAFLERAARFCCLDGGNFSEVASPYTIPHPLNPHSPDLRPMHGQHAVFECNESEWVPGMELQGHEMCRTEVFDEVSLSGMHGNEGNPFKDEKKSERFMRSLDEAEIGIDVSCKQSDKAEFSRHGAQEELDGTAGESFGKGPGLKKRKIAEQRTGHSENNVAPQASAEAANDSAEISPSGDQKQSLTNNHGGKHGRLGSQGPKEEYIHVRARRGQATNSHSLAERVRREKISERMKLLQDLVPGCSQVTGKAVMLDEIINYVLSLQRQVQFLSMKLATVNPSVDFNMEGFLAKDILKPGGGLSPSLAFPPDTVPFPPLHQPQPGLIRACLPGTVNSPDTFQRPISLPSITPCGGARQTSSQAPSVWEDELHNVVHSGFNASAPPDSQDLWYIR